MTKLKTYPALAAALVVLSTAISAEAADEGLVGRLLAQADRLAGERGFTARQTYSGSAEARARVKQTIDLPAGQLMIVGVCDGGCSDVNLVLSDRDGRIIAQDIETDDSPIVSGSPGVGSYILETHMVACQSVCAYGARVYTR